MNTKNEMLGLIDEVISTAVKQKIIHLSYENETTGPDHILKVEGKDLISFTSCSYLGLEFNESVKSASIQAINNYGVQFSSSRAYMSNALYIELESMLDKIFNAHTLATSTTTLGHISCLPVVVGPKDLVILDHQVHTSVKTAADLVKARGGKVELVRHSRVDLIETRIKEARGVYSNVWLLIDGVYSMFGDVAPKESLYASMDKYNHFRLYVDDAHGMSWTGKNGRGFFVGDREIHSQMILATSLSKGFASGGGVLVFPDAETKRLVKTCGSTFITSGPMQPGILGAAVASAKIHLSEKIVLLQNELLEKIKLTSDKLKENNLPFISETPTPVFFIPVGLPKLCYEIIDKMKSNGFFLNLSIFPAVPMKNSGIRFTITRLHSVLQIEKMIIALSKSFYEVLEKFQFNIQSIEKAFKKNFNLKAVTSNSISTKQYTAKEYSSIKCIDKHVWNTLFLGRGNFDYDGLIYLEETFSNHKEA